MFHTRMHEWNCEFNAANDAVQNQFGRFGFGVGCLFFPEPSNLTQNRSIE